MEIWKDIRGWEGKYQVSNLGRVKSISRIIKFSDNRIRVFPEKIIAVKISNSGYYTVSLWNHHKCKRYGIHRLVAETFIPNPNNYPQVNHKDEDKSNNNISNLEWCTLKYNIRYSRVRKVIQKDLNGNVIKKWDSIIDIVNTLGFKSPNIIKCCQHKINKYKDFIWEYNDDKEKKIKRVY